MPLTSSVSEVDIQCLEGCCAYSLLYLLLVSTPASGEIAAIISWQSIFHIWIVRWKDRFWKSFNGQLFQGFHRLCMLWQVQGLQFIRVPVVNWSYYDGHICILSVSIAIFTMYPYFNIYPHFTSPYHRARACTSPCQTLSLASLTERWTLEKELQRHQEYCLPVTIPTNLAPNQLVVAFPDTSPCRNPFP